MSIFLKKKNWLVADWVMKKLNRDIIEIDKKNEFQNIRSELSQSEKTYTFLLNYSDSPTYRIIELNEIVSKLISSYEHDEIAFYGDKKSFDSYKLKLMELYNLTLDEIEKSKQAV